MIVRLDSRLAPFFHFFHPIFFKMISKLRSLMLLLSTTMLLVSCSSNDLAPAASLTSEDISLVSSISNFANEQLSPETWVYINPSTASKSKNVTGESSSYSDAVSNINSLKSDEIISSVEKLNVDPSSAIGQLMYTNALRKALIEPQEANISSLISLTENVARSGTYEPVLVTEAIKRINATQPTSAKSLASAYLPYLNELYEKNKKIVDQLQNVPLSELSTKSKVQTQVDVTVVKSSDSKLVDKFTNEVKTEIAKRIQHNAVLATKRKIEVLRTLPEQIAALESL